MLEFLLLDYNVIIIFLAGASGALVADLVHDNCLEMPKKVGKRLFLGWIGGMIIGGMAGVLVDGAFITAFMGGFMGKEVIGKLTKQTLDKL